MRSQAQGLCSLVVKPWDYTQISELGCTYSFCQNIQTVSVLLFINILIFYFLQHRFPELGLSKVRLRLVFPIFILIYLSQIQEKVIILPVSAVIPRPSSWIQYSVYMESYCSAIKLKILIT